MLALNKWQRLIATLAAITSFSRAIFLFSEGDSAGSAFVAGTVFAIMAFAPARETNALFPDPRPWLTRNRRRLGFSALSLAILFAGLVFANGMIADRQRKEANIQFERHRQERNRNILLKKARADAAHASCLRAAKELEDLEKYLAIMKCDDDRKSMIGYEEYF